MSKKRAIGAIFLGCLLTLVVSQLCVESATAGWPWKRRRDRDCAVPAEAECDTSCAVPPASPPSAPSAAPTPAPQMAVSPQMPAVFQAPQQIGEVSGASESVGIRGFGIRFPEWNLQLPTIQLPSLVRYRRGSEMHLESARSAQIPGMAAMPAQAVPGAPYAIPLSAAAPPPAAPAAPPAAPQYTPPPASRCGAYNYPPKLQGAPCEARGASYASEQAELDALRRELISYREQLAEMRSALSGDQPPEALGELPGDSQISDTDDSDDSGNIRLPSESLPRDAVIGRRSLERPAAPPRPSEKRKVVSREGRPQSKKSVLEPDSVGRANLSAARAGKKKTSN